MPKAAHALPPEIEDFQRKVAELQVTFTQKIQRAQAKNDAALIQALSAEFQAEMARLTQSLPGAQPAPPAAPAPAPEPKRSSIYDNSRCAIDLDLAVYDGDRDGVTGLLTDPQFVAAAERVLDDKAVFKSRRDLLKKCLHLTPMMAPDLHAVGARCRQALGLVPELDFYVYQDLYFNAFCYPPDASRLYILLTSSLLERFTVEELSFVIGHEIGHALFDHHRLPINLLLERGEDLLSPVHAMRIYAWKRNAEISADRIGLLCGGDFESAARAFFKLSSGITSGTLAFQLREYIDQFRDLKQEMAEGADPEDWFTTHPFSPLRLKALELFAQSATYQRLRGGSGGEISEEQMERDIRELLSMMEPSYLTENTQLAQVMREFVFLGGYLISAANGVIEESEVTALGSLLDPATVRERLESMKGTQVEEVWKRLSELVKTLNLHVPLIGKLNLVKDLSIISYSDGSVEECELEVLYRICTLLGLKTEFVDHVLHSASAPMD
jgi:uncharacterized tellurite resistance protein B-like protein